MGGGVAGGQAGIATANGKMKYSAEIRSMFGNQYHNSRIGILERQHSIGAERSAKLGQLTLPETQLLCLCWFEYWDSFVAELAAPASIRIPCHPFFTSFANSMTTICAYSNYTTHGSRRPPCTVRACRLWDSGVRAQLTSSGCAGPG